MADYIPAKDADFFEWARNISTLCTANVTAWHLPEAEVGELADAVTEYITIYGIAIGPSASKADILLKNEEKADLKERIRDFKRRNIDPNTAITNPDRERLRLPIYDTKASPIPQPSTTLEFEFRYPGARRIDLYFKEFGSSNRAKPKGVAGAVAFFEIRDSPPANQDELLHSVFTGRSPYRFEFREEDRGKTIYFALRWQNAKGQLGPWSAIQKSIIP